MKRTTLEIVIGLALVIYAELWRRKAYQFRDISYSLVRTVDMANSNTSNALNSALSFESSFYNLLDRQKQGSPRPASNEHR